MKSLSLAGSDWLLRCHWPNQWHMRKESPLLARPMLPDIPATVPGGVHADLMQAGLIPDIQKGIDAFASEWVENRQWTYSKTVAVPPDFDGQLSIECEGLDYAGHVFLDGELLADFEGTHLRHRFDLGDRVCPGRSFNLEFVFEPVPDVEGQIGWTTHTRIFKPRFGYQWDWCSRVVNVGIWQDLRLVSRGSGRLESCRVLPRVAEDLRTASVRVVGGVDGVAAALRCVLSDANGRELRRAELKLAGQAFDETLDAGGVSLWWPATHGDQPLYRLRVELLDMRGQVSDVIHRAVGFKRVRWLRNPGAPAEARPYLCEINGCPVFLRGVNWVPLSPLYGTVTDGQYEQTLRLYRNMNANILRVWGGGILETESFYSWCDRLGLLVWQEFPLSSSGIENWPPEDLEVIGELQRIAAEYVERRGHHASHLLWCGGNELQGSSDGAKTGGGKPIDESHPLMRAWSDLLERIDPGKRFLATSPMGPRFTAETSDYGKGLHHHVHGPWANLPLSDRYDYWNRDDSLLRGETGAPGCASMELLERYKGRWGLWPPRPGNPAWLIPGAWWIPWDDVSREFGPIPDDPAQLPVVVKASRYLQAETYRYAAESVRRHFPHCGGFIIWMGHDCMHCAANNSVIEVGGSTKPAYDLLQRALAPRHVSMEHDTIAYPPGSLFSARIWVHCDDASRPVGGRLTVSLRGLDGRAHQTTTVPVLGNSPNTLAATVEWTVPAFGTELFIAELSWQDGETITNRYLLSQRAHCPLRPLLTLAPAMLDAVLESGHVMVSNPGVAPALGVHFQAAPGGALLTRTNCAIVFSGETVRIPYERLTGTGASSLRIECFNAAKPVMAH